jgi:hypothetical protein
VELSSGAVTPPPPPPLLEPVTVGEPTTAGEPVTVGDALTVVVPVVVTVPIGVVPGVDVLVGVVCANAVAERAAIAVTRADATANGSALRRNCMGSVSYEWTAGLLGVFDDLLACATPNARYHLRLISPDSCPLFCKEDASGLARSGPATMVPSQG